MQKSGHLKTISTVEASKRKSDQSNVEQENIGDESKIIAQRKHPSTVQSELKLLLTSKNTKEVASRNKKSEFGKNIKPRKNRSRVDMKGKLEKSRQSARECRARKKLRYQYLEDLLARRELSVISLRKELDLYRDWCIKVDQGLNAKKLLHELESRAGLTQFS